MSQVELISRLCELLSEAAAIIQAQEEIMLQHGIRESETANDLLEQINEFVG